jgi:hypothetical protein
VRWYLILKKPEPYVVVESLDEARLRDDVAAGEVVGSMFGGRRGEEVAVVLPADVAMQDPDYREAVLAWQRGDDRVWENLMAEVAAEGVVFDALQELVEEGSAPESLLEPDSEIAAAVGSQGGPDALDDVIAVHGPRTLGDGVTTYHELARDTAYAFTFRALNLWEIAERLEPGGGRRIGELLSYVAHRVAHIVPPAAPTPPESG